MQDLSSLIFLGLLIFVFYFMLIRPQKRRVEQHRRLIESIQVGDEIVTIGGLYGSVTALGDDEVEIEASPGVTLRFTKASIARRVSEDLTDDAESSETTA